MNEIEVVGSEASMAPGLAPGVLASDVLTSGDETAPLGNDRPWLYGLLIGPSAVVANGVVQGGVLSYLLSQQGVGSEGQSHAIFWLALPTSLYFLWSPITDFFVRRRTWVLFGGFFAALLMAVGFYQKSLDSRTGMLVLLMSACCAQLVVSSCGGMMGAMRSVDSRKKAGSAYQAGSMGLGALSAWVLVWMSSRTHQSVLGLAAAAMIFLPALFVFALPRQETVETAGFGKTFRRIGEEFKATFWRWEALPYVGCMIFPMASGSAVGLLPGIAKQYGVNGDSVAWINGLLGGLLVAAGSAVMAMFKVRARAAVLYMIVALINCAALCVLWLGPLAPMTYFTGVLLYLFTVGCCYAVFTMVVLEFLGDSGKSGSGRYSIINSLGNVPVLYMALVDGWGGQRWGGRGLAGAECVVGAVGASVLLGCLLLQRPVKKVQV